MISRVISHVNLCALTLLFVYTGCSLNSELRGLDDQLKPIFTARASLSLTELETFTPEARARLRVGVVWLEPNFPDSWCASQLIRAFNALDSEREGEEGEEREEGEEGEEEEEREEGDPFITPNLIADLTHLQETCRDPFGVTSQLSGPSVELMSGVEVEGRLEFEIPFTALPPSDVIYGTPDERIAYGSFIVFEDLDKNQVFTIGDRVRLDLLQEGEVDDDNADERRRWRGESRSPDTLHSASFTSLAAPQTRLVFREGTYTQSFFYPLGVGCVPPRGMSVIHIATSSLYLTDDTPCDIRALSTPIELSLDAEPNAFTGLMCEPPEIDVVRPTSTPPAAEGGATLKRLCISPDELVIRIDERPCSDVSVISLVGCPPNEIDCDDSKWDERASPPAWWPCGETP